MRLTSESPVSPSMSTAIDELGVLSANAQKLDTPITVASIFFSSKSKLGVMYLYVSGSGSVEGFLRTGVKRLYIAEVGKFWTGVCVLDFFVLTQRTGIGTALFQEMLRQQQVDPSQLAFDRPSEKMLNFLKSQFSLATPVYHHNHFVTFSGFSV